MSNLRIVQNIENQTFTVIDDSNELKTLISYEVMQDEGNFNESQFTENMAESFYSENIEVALRNKSATKNSNGYYESKIFTTNFS